MPNPNLTPDAIVMPVNGELVVQLHYPWANVDRPHTMGWNLGPDTAARRTLAGRLCKAIIDGRVMSVGSIATDTNGKTYVASASKVLGRTLNADLARLGY